MSLSKQLFADMREREAAYESAFMRGVDDYYEQQERVYDNMQEDDPDDTTDEILHFECSYKFKKTNLWITYGTAPTMPEGFKKLNEVRKRLRGRIDNNAVKIVPIYRKEYDEKEARLNQAVTRQVLGF